MKNTAVRSATNAVSARTNILSAPTGGGRNAGLSSGTNASDLSALQKWGNDHVDWWEGIKAAAGECAACEQEDDFNNPNIDLSAAMPSWYNHNLASPKCRERMKQMAATLKGFGGS